MEAVFLLIGILAGGVAAWFIRAAYFRAKEGALAGTNSRLESELADAKDRAERLHVQLTQLTAGLATAQANPDHSEQRRKDFSLEIEQMQARNQTQFENLANRILEEKTAKFTSQNQTNLQQVLDPLRQQIAEFKQKVESTHTDDKVDRATLLAQIQSLRDLNAQVTEDARNLTLALKGDSKAQGNWGELILERVLERSGLTREVEFSVQTNLKNDAGANLRPDVIIHLTALRRARVRRKELVLPEPGNSRTSWLNLRMAEHGNP